MLLSCAPSVSGLGGGFLWLLLSAVETFAGLELLINRLIKIKKSFIEQRIQIFTGSRITKLGWVGTRMIVKYLK